MGCVGGGEGEGGWLCRRIKLSSCDLSFVVNVDTCSYQFNFQKIEK